MLRKFEALPWPYCISYDVSAFFLFVYSQQSGNLQKCAPFNTTNVKKVTPVKITVSHEETEQNVLYLHTFQINKHDNYTDCCRNADDNCFRCENEVHQTPRDVKLSLSGKTALFCLSFICQNQKIVTFGGSYETGCANVIEMNLYLTLVQLVFYLADHAKLAGLNL